MNVIRYATEADVSAMGSLVVQAFDFSGFLPSTFPEASPEALTMLKGARALQHLVDTKTDVLVQTDPNINAVIGYCRWVVPQGIGFDHEVVPLSPEGAATLEDPALFTPRPMKEEVMNACKRIVEEKRKQYTTDDDFILDFLGTLPSHQGKGIGSAFIKWGLERADAAKRRAYLEATMEGFPLYYKYGWRAVEQLTLDYSEYGGVGSQDLVIMMRDPQ